MNTDHDGERKGKDAVIDLDMNRREFLGLTGTGIFLFFFIGELPAFAQMPPPPFPTDFNAYLKIGADGHISCYAGKAEMGQGVVTSLAQMLADELDAPFEAVDMVMGDTELCPWDMGTNGSRTTRFFGQALRAAGAEARLVLLELASERLKTPVDALSAERGVIVDKRNKQHRVTYGQLAQGKAIERHLSGKAAVKNPADFKIMGKSFLRRDSKVKVTGKAKYAADIQLPGMLYAKILRPPAHGSKLIDVDLSGAQRVPGVQVVRDGDFIAVLHKYPDVAELALSKVKANFDKPQSDLDEKTIFDHLVKVAPAGNVTQKGGNLQNGAQESSALFDQTYLNDYVAHAPIEPHAAVANVQGDKVTVWASTQQPYPARDAVAKLLGIPTKNVRLMPVFLGGGFGGKTMSGELTSQVIEAVRCAKLSGKPVQVARSRKEEFFYDNFRPAAVVKIKSGITAAGGISLWDYHVYFAGERGSAQFYTIPNHSTTVYNASWVAPPGIHPFATGPWRAPGCNTSTFARESQIDIMAAKAGIDPLEFRLKNMSDPKMLRVLRTVADKFGWKPAKAPSGRGLGFACGMDEGTYVATMAEVEVDKGTGAVKVKRVVCAEDNGLVMNPEGIALQMESCITMGMGYALTERIRFKGRDVFDHNFDTYEIPKFSWVPKIETVVIDDKTAPSQGVGEPAILPMGAVLANAVYDAIGIRMFQLPMTPERIKEAIKKG